VQIFAARLIFYLNLSYLIIHPIILVLESWRGDFWDSWCDTFDAIFFSKP